MLIGYTRVSKSDGSQKLIPQKGELIKFGVDEARIYEDYISSKKEHRPGLAACMKALQPSDTLVVWKLDRLGRDLKELIAIVEQLQQREIDLKVLTELGAQIDTTSANSRFVFSLFAALAEFERELISERTRAGLAAARARGRLGGRPRKMDAGSIKLAMMAMKDRNAVASQVAGRLGITRNTLYAYVNGDRRLKERGKKIVYQHTSSPNL